MKKTLNLFNESIAVDTQKFLDGKLLLQANTGGGKSWATRRVIEQFAGVVPQIILDPEGEFFTLRQKFPDFILIGKGQSIVADPKSAGLLAHKLIEERVSCIIDLLEMSSVQRDLFVKNFVSAMINAPRELWLPTLLIIDEAQIFAPEKGESDTTTTLKDAGFRFRKRHFGLILATPRISELSKSVASTCKNKLIGQASLDNDMKRSAAEIGFTTKEEVMSLRDLDPGEFYAYGPAFSKKVIKLKIGKTISLHGDSAAVNARVAKPSPKVQKALEVLANVPQEAAEEAKSVATLQVELREANGKIRALETKGVLQKVAPGLAGYVPDPKAIENAIRTRDMQWAKVVREWKEAAQLLGDALERAQKILNAVPEIEWPDSVPEKIAPYVPINDKGITVTSANVDSVFRNAVQQLKKNEVKEAGDMNTGERLILKSIAGDDEGITTEHIAVLTGYKGTSRYEYLRKLQARGFVEKRGDIFVATVDGISALGSDYEAAPVGRALQEQVLSRMGDGGEKKILQILLERYPGEISKGELQDITYYKGTSTYEYLRKLQARKLITVERGVARASDKLFD